MSGSSSTCPASVEVMRVLVFDSAAVHRDQCLAQRHGDEVLEQLRHVEQEAVHDHNAGALLHGCCPQHKFGHAQGGVVAGVEPGWLPGRNNISAVQR
jgi:hypothetical protein